MRSTALLVAAASLALTAPAAAQAPSPAAPAPMLAAAQAPSFAAPAPPMYWVPPPYYAPPTAPVAFVPGEATGPGGWWRGPDRIVTERRSPGMAIAGASLFGLGAAGTVAGAGVLLFAVTHPCVFETLVNDGGPAPRPASAGREHIRATGQALSECDGLPELGLAMMGAGAAVALVGVPFFVYGSAPAERPATQGTGLAPEVRVGAGNASLRWTF